MRLCIFVYNSAPLQTSVSDESREICILHQRQIANRPDVCMSLDILAYSLHPVCQPTDSFIAGRLAELTSFLFFSQHFFQLKRVKVACIYL